MTEKYNEIRLKGDKEWVGNMYQIKEKQKSENKYVAFQFIVMIGSYMNDWWK